MAYRHPDAVATALADMYNAQNQPVKGQDKDCLSRASTITMVASQPPAHPPPTYSSQDNGSRPDLGA